MFFLNELIRQYPIRYMNVWLTTGLFEYDKEIFPNHTYEQFLDLCHNDNETLDKIIKEELCFICKDCGSEMPILEIIDWDLEYNVV